MLLRFGSKKNKAKESPKQQATEPIKQQVPCSIGRGLYIGQWDSSYTSPGCEEPQEWILLTISRCPHKCMDIYSLMPLPFQTAVEVFKDHYSATDAPKELRSAVQVAEPKNLKVLESFIYRVRMFEKKWVSEDWVRKVLVYLASMHDVKRLYGETLEFQRREFGREGWEELKERCERWHALCEQNPRSNREVLVLGMGADPETSAREIASEKGEENIDGLKERKLIDIGDSSGEEDGGHTREVKQWPW